MKPGIIPTVDEHPIGPRPTFEPNILNPKLRHEYNLAILKEWMNRLRQGPGE